MTSSLFHVTFLDQDLAAPSGHPDGPPVPFWTYLVEMIEPSEMDWHDPSEIESEASTAVLESDEFEYVDRPEFEVEWQTMDVLRIRVWGY